MDLAPLLDDLREAAIDPEAWSRVHERTEDFFGAFSSSRAIADHRRGNALFSQTTKVPEIDAEVQTIAPTSEPVRWTSARPVLPP